MQTESQPRIAKRMPCALRVGAQRYSGVVLNVSQGGLFVQTNADTPRGASVELELNPPERNVGISVRATVMWKRVVPHQLRANAHGGIGVRIDSAAESYYQLLAGWMRVTEQPKAAAPAEPLARFRVRVLECSGPRTRRFELRANSVGEAREEALRRVGAGWRVIDIEAL